MKIGESEILSRMIHCQVLMNNHINVVRAGMRTTLRGKMSDSGLQTISYPCCVNAANCSSGPGYYGINDIAN